MSASSVFDPLEEEERLLDANPSFATSKTVATKRPTFDLVVTVARASAATSSTL